MGIFDFIKGQLLEVIEWSDDSRDTISFRFPDDDKAIKNGAQLIVRESQAAQFVYLGEFGDTFGPGKHRLTTDNIPVLTKLQSWKYGFESPFKVDIYFVNTRLFTGNKWGTANPVTVRDPDFGVVRIRAFGTYDFRIVQPALFLMWSDTMTEPLFATVLSAAQLTLALTHSLPIAVCAYGIVGFGDGRS